MGLDRGLFFGLLKVLSGGLVLGLSAGLPLGLVDRLIFILLLRAGGRLDSSVSFFSVESTTLGVV